MSGGSLDYFYFRVQEIADEIRQRAETPLQLAFVKHLEDVATALHDIEWVFSGDYGEGREEEAINKVLGNCKCAEKDIIIDKLKELSKNIEKL